MIPEPSLPQNVHQLIRVHHVMDESGGFTQQQALLDQLDTATTTTGNDGGRSNEPRIPINAAAVDLQLEIKHDIQMTEEERTGKPGTARSILCSWATEDRPEWEAHLADKTAQMIRKINATINPPPRRRELHMNCPACGTMYRGENRKPALTADVWDNDGNIKHPDEYHVECSECGAEWKGEEISWLTVA